MKATPVTVGTTFDGSSQSFSAGLTGSGTLSGNASGNLGAIALDVPQQSVGVALAGGTSIQSVPRGTATLGFDNQTLANRTVSALDVDVLHGVSVPFSLTPIALSGNVTIEGTSYPATFRFSPQGQITQFHFTQSPGTVALPGAIPGAIEASLVLNLNVRIAFSIFDVGVAIDPVPVDFTTPAAVPGSLNLIDLNPGQPFPHDLLANLTGQLASLDIPVTANEPFQIVEGPPLNADISGMLDLAATLRLQTLGYSLVSVLPDSRVTPCELVGDANGDRSVGAADYAIWAAQFGRSGAALAADFDKNGNVGSGDYALWAANFGSSCPGVASVPEPAAKRLALLGSALLVLGRRRKKR